MAKKQNSVCRGSCRQLALVSGITGGGGEEEERSDRGGETARGKKHVTKVNDLHQDRIKILLILS